MSEHSARRGGRAEGGAVAALVALALLVPGPAGGQSGGAAEERDPAAIAALDAMGAHLRTLQVFQVAVTTTQEEVLESGLKVQYTSDIDLLARLPDAVRADVASDRQERQYLYDGRQFTLWAKRVGYYATVPAPPTVKELVDVLAGQYGIEIPLVDLFRWGAAGTASAGITAAVDLGGSVVAGTTCQHYAFRQEGLDWQIWIQKGAFPLPRKLVLTTTTDEARPQFEASYTWNLAPSFNAAAFTFDPPPGAQRIVFAEVAGSAE